MTKDYPDKKEAHNILQEVVKQRAEKYKIASDGLVFHSEQVAYVAEQLAFHTPHLIPEKAYTLGLLHDIGRVKRENFENCFHGRSGYEYMMEKGYPIAARICLTHTFPNKNFSLDEYSYPLEWLKWVQKKLILIEYDDYDRLIQFSDKLSSGISKTITTIEERIKIICDTYSMNEIQTNRLVEESVYLKSYFDKLCGSDVYKILAQ